MFDNERQDEDLNAFEAALGSLRPRADGLDRRWRLLLAQEAAFNRNLPASDVLAAGQLLCVRCGTASSIPRGKHRWAWPAAFAGMTVVAAALLAALVVRSESQIAVTGAGPRVATSATSLAKNQASNVAWLARESELPRRLISDSAETSYLKLRDQVLCYGVDSWSPPAATVATTTIAEPPSSYREQLNRLLKREGSHGS